ncbi:MAG: zinc dependent phospholipase C family protein [Terracidiphilus sp.]
MRGRRLLAGMALLALLWLPQRAHPYSLLTHEQMIDLTWQNSIVPLLLSEYPTLTPAELEEARAYAYGGCVIQDIGYYPFGDPRFSNLTHYVRSGDFVVNLFRNARNPNELAFAVGALSHYVGDSVGHSTATNLAVPLDFPRLRKKYGLVVSYAEGPHQHVQTEFGFDINEVAHHRMAPINFLRQVGLRVPVRQLALAYYQTYGLTEDFSVVKGRRFNVPGYRFATRTFIPRVAYAVTMLHRRREPTEPDNAEVRELQKEIDNVAAENHWSAYREKAGFETYALAGLLAIVPRVGPLRLAAVKDPSSRTEEDYIHSLTLSLAEFRHMLAEFTPPDSRKATPGPDAPKAFSRRMLAQMLERPDAEEDVLQGSNDSRHPLPNRDLDTGYLVQPGGYPLTDATYADLLRRLARRPAQPIPPGIKENIEAYYANPDAPITTKRDPQRWAQVEADLQTLATMHTSRAPEPYPTYADDLQEDE